MMMMIMIRLLKVRHKLLPFCLRPEQTVCVGNAFDAIDLDIPLSQLIHVNGQPAKALEPIVVTLLGILIEVSDIQPQNIPLEMVVILLGIDTAINDIHCAKA